MSEPHGRLRIAGARPSSGRLFRNKELNGADHGARKGQTIEGKGGEDKTRKEKVRQIGQADRALLLANAKRLQDFDHAGGVRPAIRDDAGEYLQGRAV